MAANTQGVGDPLGHENPYRDGRPNWNLQTKIRVHGPNEKLGTGLLVSQPQVSPYAQDFPQAYSGPEPVRDKLGRGRRHFACHIASTTDEQVWRGLGVPEHLASGKDVPARGQGRRYLRPQETDNPKDGGVWEPVARKYPKVERAEWHSGVRVVDRLARAPLKIDIWPSTITVRDEFKPGGLKMFAGRRATNTEAFPGARGYVEPQAHDAAGNRIDYSSVAQGGPFGRKMLHANEQVPAPAVERLHPDRTQRALAKAREGDEGRRAALRTPQGFAAAWRDAPPPARAAPPSRAAPPTPFSQGSHPLPSEPLPRAPSLQPERSRSAAFAVPAPPSRSAGAGSAPREVGVASAGPSRPRPFAVPGGNGSKGRFEQPLSAATSWTFMGGYRP